jgi:hypothetical protein
VIQSRFALVFTMTLLVMSVLLWALYEADPLALLSADGLGSSTKLTIGRTTAETADSPVPIQRPSSEPSQSSNQSGSAKTADELAQTKTRENSVVPQRQDGDEPIPGGQPQNRTFGNSGTEPPAARSEPVSPSTGFSSSGSGGAEVPADKPENGRQSNQALSRPDVAGNPPKPYENPESRSSIPEPAQRSGSAKTADESSQSKTRENSVVPQRQHGGEPVLGGQPQSRTLGNSVTEPSAARSEPPVARSEPVFPSTGFSSSGSRGPEAPADKPENARQSNQAPSRPDVAGNLRKPYENPESRSSIPEPAQPQPRCRTRDSSDSHSIRAECKLNNKRAEYHPKRKRANSPIQTIDVYAGGAHIIIICNLRSRRGARESGC